MAELIDRNAFRDFWNKNYRHQYANDTFLFAIANFPTTDAVPVVRCKDCKHSGVMEDTGKRYCKYPMGCLGCTPTEPDNFCSYGKRKDDD